MFIYFFTLFQTFILPLEDKEIMTDPIELEPEETGKDPETKVSREGSKAPSHEGSKIPSRESSKAPSREGSKAPSREGSKAPLSREGTFTKPPLTPSEEERSATRTLIRQPEPVLETSDGEDEPEQVQYLLE